MKLNRKIIPHTVKNKTANRIGGNMPAWFLNKINLLANLNFYASFEHPFDSGQAISLFIPRDHAVLLQGKIYPNSAIKVFVHPHSDEGGDTRHSCPDVEKTYFAGFTENEDDEGVVQAGGMPQWVQDEEYYWADLEKDGYVFFMQIDEALYPDDLVTGSYPFDFGVLYLYCKPSNMCDIVAGFWQNS